MPVLSMQQLDLFSCGVEHVNLIVPLPPLLQAHHLSSSPPPPPPSDDSVLRTSEDFFNASSVDDDLFAAIHLLNISTDDDPDDCDDKLKGDPSVDAWDATSDLVPQKGGKTLIISVVGNVVNDTLPMEFEAKFNIGKYLFYTGGGDRCKLMNHYLWSFLCTQSGAPKIQPLNPISIEQPAGPSFVVEGGHVVKWVGWEFHLKANARARLMVSAASMVDPETREKRAVMYKSFTSELFVPYIDPTDA